MIALCQEHRLEHRTKHIALRYFLARELQQRGQLRLAYVATRANTADIFTKALPPGDHQRFSTVLGLLAFLCLTGLVTTCAMERRGLALSWWIAGALVVAALTIVRAERLDTMQVQVLKDLKAAWGLNAQGWGDDNPDCSTTAYITCDGDGWITKMILKLKNLSGSIPATFSWLFKLEVLDLSYNRLTGSLPNTFTSLLKLQSLSLHVNQFTGTLPHTIGFLSDLTLLRADLNQLTGSIPAQYGSLKKLITLNLHYNQFTGSLPFELGSLTNLKTMNLFRNKLTGPIPNSYSSLTALTDLNVYNNLLSGSFPDTFGNLAGLQYLVIGRNNFSGSIPEALFSLTNLNNL
ncbi:unnamed protein product, partial [Closterium sp. NIES-53]